MGQLGTGDTADRFKPTPTKNTRDLLFFQISAGGEHSMAVTSLGKVYVWGKDSMLASHLDVFRQVLAHLDNLVRTLWISVQILWSRGDRWKLFSCQD